MLHTIYMTSTCYILSHTFLTHMLGLLSCRLLYVINLDTSRCLNILNLYSVHAKFICVINIVVTNIPYYDITIICALIFTLLIITLHHYAHEVVCPPSKCDSGPTTLQAHMIYEWWASTSYLTTIHQGLSAPHLCVTPIPLLCKHTSYNGWALVPNTLTGVYPQSVMYVPLLYKHSW